MVLVECVIRRDYEGARLSAKLSRQAALVLGLNDVRSASGRVLLHLRPANTEPPLDVGAAVLHWVIYCRPIERAAGGRSLGGLLASSICQCVDAATHVFDRSGSGEEVVQPLNEFVALYSKASIALLGDQLIEQR